MPAKTSPASHQPFCEPRLAIAWEPPGEAFLSSLRAFLRSPRAPKGWPRSEHLRDCFVRYSFPTRAVVVSMLWHVVLFTYPFPIWKPYKPKTQLAVPRIEITWFGPIRDLPPLLPSGPSAKASPPGEPKKPLPRRGADAFHPRQTIISNPLRPTHPRQTLIQPEAPPEPPKILPQLPNIVQWSEPARPARPRLKVDARALAKLGKRSRAVPAPAEPALPDVAPQLGELNFATSPMTAPKTRLAVRAGAAPKVAPRQVASEAEPAPNIGPVTEEGSGGTGSLRRLIALSATPAEPLPILEVPVGNLAARFTISPEGKQPRSAGGSPEGVPGGTGGEPGGAGGTGGGGGGNAAVGPPGVTISGGDPDATSPVAGLSGTGVGRPMTPAPLPPKPEPARLAAVLLPGRTRPTLELDSIKPGAPSEQIFGPRPVYTLHVNMPNLTSATGSWVLRFAELQSDEAADWAASGGSGELAGPVPLRKVDPKYPPALISARVQGEVVLYAIIRKDGSVDSIQVMRSVEPQLDRNAIEALARWKFRPAERNGKTVELEAVIHIPFRCVAPL